MIRDGTKFRSVTEYCRSSGRCFSFQAQQLFELGKIDKDDPRYVFRRIASTQNVPRTHADYRDKWKKFFTQAHPPEVKASLLIADNAFKKQHQDHVDAFDLAVCLESASIHVARANKTRSSKVSPADYIQQAVFFCDADVLARRHCDERNKVSRVSQSSGLQPQRVLSGMMRKGFIQNNDFRVQAFIHGQLSEFNEMDRTDFFENSSKHIRHAITHLSSTDPTFRQKRDVTNAMQNLSFINQTRANPVLKEVDVLDATAALTEALGSPWDKADKRVSQNLAAISMSSSSRSLLMREQHAELFVTKIPKTNIIEKSDIRD